MKIFEFDSEIAEETYSNNVRYPYFLHYGKDEIIFYLSKLRKAVKDFDDKDKLINALTMVEKYISKLEKK